MLPADITIEDLLPHREGMLLITEVLRCDDQGSAARCVVKKEWPLVDERGVSPIVLVELVAQTAAINNGLQILRKEGPGADHRGWIVGIKSARFHVNHLPLGTEIVVTSQNQFEFEGFREIGGTAEVDGQLAAEVVLQLMQAKKE